MSTWSEDNFGTSGAREYLTMLIARLMGTITEVVSDPERSAADEDGEAMLMPSVEVLALLCERYDAPPPHTGTVRQWRQHYLDTFDRTAGGLELSPDQRAARRKVIDNTFRWLESVATAYWEDG